MENKGNFIYSFSVAVLFLVVMWAVFLFNWMVPIDLRAFSLQPGSVRGLAGIFLSPFIHIDFLHILSNSLPFFALCVGLFYFYPSLAWLVFTMITICTGAFVWIVAPAHTYHIGASGLIYGFASFLFFSGILRKNIRLMALSVIVYFLYGGMIWGILPGRADISWQSHLGGLISGIVCAIIFRRYGPRNDRYAWENEIDDGEPHFGIKDYIEMKAPENED